MTTILVLGGYGIFGQRAVERLARSSHLTLIIAGRSRQAAEILAHTLQPGSRARLLSTELDATSLTAADLRRLGVSILLHTAGPFQGQDHRVAHAAIEARVHYIDIADARDFVTGIASLHAAALAADVLVVSGASSVPALAAAVIDHALVCFSKLTTITYGISPGDSFTPGTATVASILGAAGRPFQTLTDKSMKTVYGWQPLRSHHFRDSRVGTRWFGYCDIPDLAVFPSRYPTLETQHFIAGTEVKAFHFSLWLLSWFARLRWISRPARLAGHLLNLKRRLPKLGSERGVMFMDLEGTDVNGKLLAMSWELVADCGHGPYIPISPAVILAKRLALGTLEARGAMPCVGLISFDEFRNEVADLDIKHGFV